MTLNSQTLLAEQYINSTDTSLFLTGRAGTGKTTFLHHIVSTTTKRCVVVAPTGVAAINAGGVTIHSFFQLPPCAYLPDVPDLLNEYQLQTGRRQMRREKMNIIRTLELLIIDEISMVRADLLDAIDHSLRLYRRSGQPFGGVQLLMIGDVQQLPPVVTDEEKPYLEQVYPSPFFFCSKALQRTHYLTIELTQVYRQSDAHFVQLLNRVRDGQFDADTLATLNSRLQHQLPEAELDGFIRLTTHNAQANNVNQQRLEALPGTAVTYDADIDGTFPTSSVNVDEHLQLKKGAQVMFVKNDSSGMHRYYNGKIGQVTKCNKNGIEVQCEGEEPIEVPRERWENVQYSIDPDTKAIGTKVDGTFLQYPLRTAWAITIHKAQGLTFDHVIVDAAEAFAYGQVYVALSRCRTLEGLVLASPIVAGGAIADQQVAHFTAQFSTEYDLRQQLPSHKARYFFSQLQNLFDFESLSRMMRELSNLYASSFRSTYPEQTTVARQLASDFDEQVYTVSLRFREQLQHIGAQCRFDPSNSLLRERAQKALQYFSSQMAAAETRLTELLTLPIDNKEVAQQMQTLAATHEEVWGEKLYCLTQLEAKGFDTESYLRCRATYRLREQASPRRASRTANRLATAHPQLAAQLQQWRADKAEELHISTARVLPIRVLRAIANEPPSSADELAAIGGLGKTRLKQFGHELADILSRYCREHGLPFDNTLRFAEDDTPPWIQAAHLFCEQQQSVASIASTLDRAVSTVEGYLLRAVTEGIMDSELVLDDADEIVQVCLAQPDIRLRELHDRFDGRYSYLQLRVGHWLADQLRPDAAPFTPQDDEP